MISSSRIVPFAVVVIFICCGWVQASETNFSHFNLKNETDNLLIDTYSPEIKYLNLSEKDLFDMAMISSPDDQFEVGLIFGKGEIVKRNFSNCIKLLEKASEKGNADAAFLLGTIYLKGGNIFEEVTAEVEYGGIIIPRDFPYDLPKAFNYFLISGNQGDQLSHDVCCILKKRILDTNTDDVKAKKMLLSLEESAGGGNALAQRFLAELYSEGKMVKQDDFKAFDLFKESAEHGDVWGEYNIARKYISGLGVEQNTSKGFEWMKKAAEHNLSEAQFDLAVLYYLGSGTVINKQLGYVWLLVAKANGHKEAESLVNESDNGGLTQEEENQAYDMAAELLARMSPQKETSSLHAALSKL